MTDGLDDIVLLENSKEDPKVVLKDCAKGGLMQMGAVFLMGYGAAVAIKYPTRGIQDLLIKGAIVIPSFIFATILFGMSCYYVSSPTERKNYQDAHPWIPNIIAKYLSK